MSYGPETYFKQEQITKKNRVIFPDPETFSPNGQTSADGGKMKTENLNMSIGV